jgi:hypothetical protein
VHFHSTDAYVSLVQALHHSLGDRPIPTLNDEYWDEYALRDRAERFALEIVEALILKHGVKRLLEAGFVPRYLAHQPWGESKPERHRNFRGYAASRTSTLGRVIVRLKETTLGYRALQLADLMPSFIPKQPKGPARRRRPEGGPDGADAGGSADEDDEDDEDYVEEEGASDDDDDDDDDDSDSDSDDSDDNSEDAENVVPRERWQTDAEQRLRRQHREAMVLNDGSRPVRRRDIFEMDEDVRASL